MAEPTPRDTLLDHAYEIADKYGLAALSVRGLASDCNVSVGTIYNHFASKGELTTATTALYFKRAMVFSAVGSASESLSKCSLK